MSIRTRMGFTLSLMLLLLTQGATAAGTDAKDTPPKPAPSAAPATTASVPQGFSSYAAEPAGDNKQCVVGAVADADGMNQKPFVYVEDTDANRVLWTRPLELPAHTYQGRATHCLHKGGTVYVLLQADTQAAQSLAQTSLRVIELDVATGSVTGNREVPMPGAADATSAWVDKGEDAFRLAGKNGLAISGEYFRLADPDKHLTFTVTLH
ncbi:hypothetical protein [Dyella sp. 2RAB6]|uniref:hypothetical protein n=1 Tax=Dyella sp. 2RAB6 TaxID=3232992 RepID=UPI003F8E42A1